LLPPGPVPADLSLEPFDPEDDGDAVDDDDPWQPIEPIQPSSTRQRGPASWRQLLDTISSAAAGAPALRSRLASGQLLYVIDAQASATSGALVLELMTRDRKKNGEWGKPRQARVTPNDIRSHPDLVERQILERLLGPRPYLDGGNGAWDGYGAELTRLHVRGVVASEIVPRLCDTGRCMLRTSAPGTTTSTTSSLLPMTWDPGEPWKFTAAISAVESTTYVVEGWFARDGQRMELSEPVLVLADGLLFTRTHAARLSDGGAFAWLAALRQGSVVTVPSAAREDLIDALLASSLPVAEVPDDLRVETVQGHPRPHLRLRTMRTRPDRLRVELSFEYEGTVTPLDSPQPIVRLPGSTRAIRRDADAERRALETLHQHGCRNDWSHYDSARVLQVPANLLPRLVHALLSDGWSVEAEGRMYRRTGTTALHVRSGIDWFELHGEVAYDDQRVSLPALLAARDRGDAFVTLGDGSIGLLPDEWLRRYATLAQIGSIAGDHVRFRASQASLLDAAIGAQPEVSWDDTFDRARAELRTFDGIRPADPPATFVGSLRGYQREGLGWLLFLQRFGFGGCLADDMGLGKTVMVLALLAARRETIANGERRPSLVVAPRSLVFNWRQEAERFTPDLRVLEYIGADRATARTTFDAHDLVLTTYGTLRRDAELLSDTLFDYVVLDESQAIKNATTASARAARDLNARHRLALSGTPIENHIGEVWSLFEFLNPGLLGTSAAFRSGASRGMGEDEIAVLAKGLRPFMLRRTKDQVASDLPQKTEQTLYCELERPQRALYDELRAHYRRTLLDNVGANGFGRAKLQILEALLRLRQAACHPGLVDRHRASDPSAKLEVLIPRLAEVLEEGHKTLVFSQFTSFLAIVRAALDKTGTPYEYLDGRTRDRQARVERFQTDPECRLFLISLKAGGLGLNLTAAEYVFLLDPWWNPAVEAQAIDRAHRIGQTRHVFAYRLIARDTVEERVLELQQRKRQLADAILSENTSVIRDLRREDLELLLS
jgi:superfamily II DNA or RNA helicase